MRAAFLTSILAGLCGMLICSGVENAKAAATSLEQEDFVVVNDVVDIPERGPVAGYCILSGGLRFHFLPPLRWRMETNRKEKTVTLTPPELNTAIRIRLLQPEEPEKSDGGADREERLVRARYPDAEIKQKFACHTGSNPGMAFDLEQDYGGNLRLESRVAFVPHQKGVVEIRQTMLAGAAAADYKDLGTLLTSFRITAQLPVK